MALKKEFLGIIKLISNAFKDKIFLILFNEIAFTDFFKFLRSNALLSLKESSENVWHRIYQAHLLNDLFNF